ncbi:hypothetical protein J6590_037552 [Homalodisca vitripennis]|nr:hypothetical protein J6590_037552 [Homalodisca vitripennis]
MAVVELISQQAVKLKGGGLDVNCGNCSCKLHSQLFPPQHKSAFYFHTEGGGVVNYTHSCSPHNTLEHPDPRIHTLVQQKSAFYVHTEGEGVVKF